MTPNHIGDANKPNTAQPDEALREELARAIYGVDGSGSMAFCRTIADAILPIMARRDQAKDAESTGALLQDDLKELLRLLGMYDGARAQSPHEVFQEALRALRVLLAAKDAEIERRRSERPDLDRRIHNQRIALRSALKWRACAEAAEAQLARLQSIAIPEFKWTPIGETPQDGGPFEVGGYVSDGVLPRRFVHGPGYLVLLETGPDWSSRKEGVPLEYYLRLPSHPEHRPSLQSTPAPASAARDGVGEPKRRVYLDLDGVMADFDAHFPATFGLDHRNLADDAMWQTINGHPSYFRDMPPCAGAINFFRSIAHLRPIILTACPRTNYTHVARQKRAWVREHLSKHVTVLPVMGGRNKPLFMQEPGDILIDDFATNIEAWETAFGVGILHKSFEETAAALRDAASEGGRDGE